MPFNLLQKASNDWIKFQTFESLCLIHFAGIFNAQEVTCTFTSTCSSCTLSHVHSNRKVVKLWFLLLHAGLNLHDNSIKVENFAHAV